MLIISLIEDFQQRDNQVNVNCKNKKIEGRSLSFHLVCILIGHLKYAVSIFLRTSILSAFGHLPVRPNSITFKPIFS